MCNDFAVDMLIALDFGTAIGADMSMATLKLALKISDNLKADHMEFVADRDADRRRGFRPRHCEHGTYLWVDHDPICGGCEDGYTMSDPMTRRTAALAEARSRMERINALAEHAFQIRILAPGLNIDSIIEEIKRLGTV